MREENIRISGYQDIRIQAGGEFRKKVENVKTISFLLCTATLPFANVICVMEIGCICDVRENFCLKLDE
jgi:hypothetical protein